MTSFKRLPIDYLVGRWKERLPSPVSDAYVDMAKILSERDDNIGTILSQGINFPDNFDGKIVSYASNAVADTEDSVAHGLDRIPLYFIVLSLDKAGVVYASSAFDGTNLKLKCSAASTAIKLLVF